MLQRDTVIHRDNDDSKVILVTFAGRKDRMELLGLYVNAAIERGIIDEWHVWDFTRDKADAKWLREQFPSVRLTPSIGTEYFSTRHELDVAREPVRYEFSVAASNDVHVGLRRLSGTGASYEIVLGGWDNGQSAIRAFSEQALLMDVGRRTQDESPLVIKPTPGLLPEWGFSKIAVEVAQDRLRATVGGIPIVEYRGKIEPGEFEVLYRSGFGCNAEWRFGGEQARGSYLFLSGMPALRAGLWLPSYTPFYQHYIRHSQSYVRDIIVKCDDDIVFVDLERLGDFVKFRRDNPEYFLISANVVNNGVCAYFQQQQGIIPETVLALELPPRGVRGTLWASAQKAATLHRYFLQNVGSFTGLPRDSTEWNDRISINFVSWLGSDFAHMSDTALDDEDYLSYQARWRSRKKGNAIYWPFVVSHLSFYSQDKELDIAGLVADYHKLAWQVGVKPPVSRRGRQASRGLLPRTRGKSQ
jgi:hypothetical protein